jgi:hypothetical protein
LFRVIFKTIRLSTGRWKVMTSVLTFRQTFCPVVS